MEFRFPRTHQQTLMTDGITTFSHLDFGYSSINLLSCSLITTYVDRVKYFPILLL